MFRRYGPSTPPPWHTRSRRRPQDGDCPFKLGPIAHSRRQDDGLPRCGQSFQQKDVRYFSGRHLVHVGADTLEEIDGGRTRVQFGETYHAFNPVLRLLFEGRVHRFISKDNDRVIREAVEQGVAARRARRAGQENKRE